MICFSAPYWNGWLFLFILMRWLFYDSTSLQPSKSYSNYCITVPVRNGPVSSPPQDLYNYRKRIKCRNPAFIQSITDIYPASLPVDTVLLDLSGNSLTELTNSSLSNLGLLEKLNVGNNQINIIYPGAFRGLENVKYLNLSYNHLRAIDNTTFENLIKLEKLFLAGNYLSKISDGTFDVLVSLQQIDLAFNPLICDCHLQWLLSWSKAKAVQLSPRTTCQYPPQLKSTRLPKIKPNQWHCDWPPQVPYFVLLPSQSQVVFSGDSLQFQCHVSNVDSSIGLSWTLNDIELDQDGSSDELITDVQSSADGMLLLSSLIVPNLTQSHTGTWKCWFRTVNGNETRSVFIRVLSEDTHFCSEAVTSGNKGNYLWPRTVAGVKVELHCWTPASTVQKQHPKVSYTCTERGTWENLNTSKCPYVSEVTKVLEHFAKTNLNITSSSVIESVHRLKNYTGDGSMLADKMDVVFISRTINNYLEFVPKYKEIGDVLIDIIATVMGLNDNLLRAAQLEDRACSKLVEAVEKLPELINEGSVSRQSSGLAVEEFSVDASGFRGVTCASFIRTNTLPSQQGRSVSTSSKKHLRCLLGNLSNEADQDDNELLEASIHLPASLLHTIVQQESNVRLQISIYRNSLLFPQTHQLRKPLGVVSGVIGGKLAKASLINLTEPVFVTLRSPNAVGQIIPVWWNFSDNGKLGDWSSEGCQLRSVYGNLVSFQCDRLANFGLLQDVEKVPFGAKGKTRGAEFRILHPVLYVGSAISIHSLLAAIVTYILGFRLIHMPKKNKHSLINICISIALLCLVYTLGIRHTEEAKICQGVGLVLHYLTLVCLLWMVIIASNTYKKLNRSDHSDSYSDEPPADYPIPPKPMLRFYLVGWGVPVIICGISAAVNLEDYAGHDYCFLAHSVGAFYYPCGFLLFLLCVFYLLIFCAIKKNAAQDKRERSARETTEIELLESTNGQLQTSAGCINHTIRSNSENSSEDDDLEQSPASQLRAQIVALLLFLSCWASAAVSTIEPFSMDVSLAELLFGCVYAASATSLGVFILVSHCATREDVRLVWKMLYHCRESSIVRETVPLPQSNITNSAGISDMRHSNDSLNSSFTSKSCSTTHSVDGAKARLPKVSNVDAAMAMAGGVTDTSWSGEMFYNPHQNGVARKYFKKRARQQQQSKNECPILEEDRIVEVNPVKEIEKMLPGLVPTRIKDKQAVIQSTLRAVKRDPSAESQLFSSSSQGLVSMSPSLSTGNRSDRSLLIVEEEDEEVDSEASQNTTTHLSPRNNKKKEDKLRTEALEFFEVDWGSTNAVSPNDMQFSPPGAMDDYTPTEPQTKDISVGCDLNDFCEEEMANTITIPGNISVANPKIGSEGDLLSHHHSNKLSNLNDGEVLPHRSGTLPRSNWEKQFELSRRSNQPIYAYVNHSHHQNLASVLDDCKGPKCEGVMTRSASVGDTELVSLNLECAQAKISQPCLQLGRLVYEQIGKKETAV